jgi:hypothetical protein
MSPSITAGREGTIWVSWLRNTDADPYPDQIYISAGNSEGFGPASCLSSDELGVSWLASCTDSLGRVWVVWGHELDGDPFTDEILARCFDGSWSEEQVVSTAGSDNLECAVSPLGAGGILVVWRTATAPFRYDIVGRAFDGERWHEPVTVMSPGADEWSPACSEDQDGNLWTAWVTNRRGCSNLYSGRALRGGGLSSGYVMRDLEGDDDPALCPDARGGMWLAWERDLDGDHRPDDIYACYSDGRAWGPLQRVTPEGIGEAHNPVMAVDREGRVWVAWNTDNGDWNVYASTLQPDLAPGELPGDEAAQHGPGNPP